jgi:hypothetical protein
MVAGAAVAALVLLLVVTPGRGQPVKAANSPRPTATPTPSPSSSTSSMSESAGGTAAGTIPGVLPPVSTDLHRHLLGVTARWELFGRGDDVVVRIQPALGRVTQTHLPYLQSTGPVAFLAVRDRVLIRPLDVAPGYEIRDGRPAGGLTGDLQAGGLLFPGPDPDHVWMVVGDAGRVELVLVRADDSRREQTLPLPSDAAQYSVIADGAGSVLLYGIGGVYAIRPDGLHRITTGELLAAGPSGWLTVECDERYRCATVVQDRSGHATALPGATLGSGNFGGYIPPGVISPDGTRAAVFKRTQASAPVLDLLDLRSGARHRVNVDLGDGADGSAVTWSPDGRWLFVLDEAGRLRVVDPASGTVTELLPDLPHLVQLSIRPAP